VYLAARLALDGFLTVGMIFAFVAYKRQFIEKTVLLVEKAIDFRLLDLHLERLADIALSPRERGHDAPLAYTRRIIGRIELRNVCFRYAETEPFVLNNINLTVEPGQFLTIMGSSGGGKTTLMKIMLGLLEPTSGEVLIDGVPMATIGPRAYREHVGAVMQEDQLLSGSIADNICFFDPEFDEDRMINCARLAQVHDEIMALPMSYNSLVGDMGSSLSGGQKQRVLLARALYRRPKILFLDEGTAHLDVENERHINESLNRLAMTRVSVAHRPEITCGADFIVELSRERGLVKRTSDIHREITDLMHEGRAGDESTAPRPAPKATRATRLQDNDVEYQLRAFAKAIREELLKACRDYDQNWERPEFRLENLNQKLLPPKPDKEGEWAAMTVREGPDARSQ
jgi:ATP-binding cassette subfamily B protein RaxB